LDWLGIINFLASAATAIGVLMAWQQVKLARRLAKTQFEDELAKQFRDIIWHIPVEALMGQQLSEEKYQSARDDFFRYVDLSNEQVFLRRHNRVSEETWWLWCEGMKAFLSRPAFRKAWEEFKAQAPDIFKELRRLEEQNFACDPREWGPAVAAGRRPKK